MRPDLKPINVALTASSGIYTITNTVNGKVYVGSAKNLSARRRMHRSHLLRGLHHSIKLQRAWNKYGPNAFVFAVIEEVKEPTNLIAREQEWLERTQACKSGYNILPTAGSSLGHKFGPEFSAKMSAILAARPPISEETRQRLSAAQKGHPVSAEQRAKIKAANCWYRHSEETRKRMSLKKKGVPRAPETRAKIAAANRRRALVPMSLETRAKMSASAKARPLERVAILVKAMNDARRAKVRACL